MNRVYLLTGGNIGNRQQYLQDAITQIKTFNNRVEKISALYQTAPWGNTGQAAFLNQALEIATNLTPEALLEQLQSIEFAAGRERLEHYGPRTLDIDIIFYGDQIINTPVLTVPHPHMMERRFVLEPLAEIAPDFVHPVIKKTVATLLLECTDTLAVKKFSGG